MTICVSVGLVQTSRNIQGRAALFQLVKLGCTFPHPAQNAQNKTENVDLVRCSEPRTSATTVYIYDRHSFRYKVLYSFLGASLTLALVRPGPVKC